MSVSLSIYLHVFLLYKAYACYYYFFSNKLEKALITVHCTLQIQHLISTSLLTLKRFKIYQLIISNNQFTHLLRLFIHCNQ